MMVVFEQRKSITESVSTLDTGIQVYVNYRSYFERMKGVKLPSDWDVHHIDFNRENNDIDNLYAMPRVMHKFIHKHWGLCDRQELNLELKNWITELNCIHVYGKRVNNPNRLPDDRKKAL